ncbi:MAG: mechanosensitive ion channel [Candidatus Melainabacteria bacterium]|nr:mechanosensitive ion channel [Candidatus Melainabacteria bacterium]
MNEVLTRLKDVGLSTWNAIVDPMTAYLPSLLVGIGILIGGWLIAIVVSNIVAWTIQKTTLDKILSTSLDIDGGGKNCPVTNGVKTIVYYLILMLFVVEAFKKLDLGLVTAPISEMINQIFDFAPNLLGALGLLVLAWALATISKKLINGVLDAIKFDELVSMKAGKSKDSIHLTSSIAETVYWLVMLLILPSVLNSLTLTSVVAPLNNMFSELLGHLPNILSAAIILLVGWFLARIIQRVVTNLLTSVGADNLIDGLGLSSIFGKAKLSEVLGMVTYVFVLFPVLIQALDALALEAVVKPASDMLAQILDAVPMIFAALIMIALAVIVGRFASNLVGNLLQSVGFDNVMSWLGVGHEAPKNDASRPSTVVSKLVLIAVILFASVEAFNMLGLTAIGGMLQQFIAFGGKIILGIIILAVGFVLSNLASNAIKGAATTHGELLAGIARIAILIIASAMGLQEMGLGQEIITNAFSLLFGAIAVAIALAVGLGCKDIAAKEVEKLLKSLK